MTTGMQSPQPGEGLRIALVAFGCLPNAGSEQRAGWQWATSLANTGAEVVVFTNGDQRKSLEKTETSGLRFEWVEARAPKLVDLRPAYRSSFQYVAFLRRCRDRVREVHAVDPFDVGLHASWSQIRSGTALSDIDGLPFVFGPVGGGQRMPLGLVARELRAGIATELFRNAQVATVRWNRMAQAGCRQAALVLAANVETAKMARSLGARNVMVKPDGGLSGVPRAPTPLPSFDDGLRLLWVGRLMPRKGLRIALDAVEIARRHVDVRLTVAGDGATHDLLEPPPSGVSWLGQVPPSRLPELFDAHHVHLFTSLRESGAPPVIEAIGFGRPTICLDQHGPAAIVDSSNGVFVDPANRDLAKGFADAIIELATNPEAVRALADGTSVQRAELDQSARAAWMIEQLEVAAASAADQ